MASVEKSIGNVVSLHYIHQDPRNILLPSNKVKRSIDYRAYARDVIKFQNPKIKGHQSFYSHQAKGVLNLYLFTTFQLNGVLRLETSAF